MFRAYERVLLYTKLFILDKKSRQLLSVGWYYLQEKYTRRNQLQYIT